MSSRFAQVFNKSNNIVIGALHFPPSKGFADFPGFEIGLRNALADLEAFEKGGVTAVIIENNYDIPHTQFVTPEVVETMLYFGTELRKATKLPLGVSVLWNDYKAALTIAKSINASFIRIPVFVDKVKTSYGIIEESPEKILEFRKSIDAEDIMLFTDIHVKHSEILSPYSITESAQRAVTAGADALIVTGQWTGSAPDLTQLREVREQVGDFPIFCGSGVDATNVQDLFEYATGAIVSTSLKEGVAQAGETNVKGYDQRISLDKVRELTSAV